MDKNKLYRNTKNDYKLLQKIGRHEVYNLSGGENKGTITEICEFESHGPDPVSDCVIASCSLFKLNDMYRDITVYLKGLKKIIDFIHDPENTTKIHLIIYYDHSVEKDEKWIDLKTDIIESKKYPKIQLKNTNVQDLYQGIYTKDFLEHL